MSDTSASEIAASCPACYQEEIVAGRLICAEGHIYPVRGGIPRLLLAPDGLCDSADARAMAQVRRRFEFQWQTWGGEERLFGQTDEDMAKRLVGAYTASVLSASFYKDRLVLDAGCGHGRYLSGFAGFGAEVVGMDYGSCVEAAAARNGGSPLVHLVQGDVTFPPFRPDTFDLVLSFGVLQFTPSPVTAFERLARTVRPDGFFYIWVYPKGSVLWEMLQSLIRAVTTRLPDGVLYALCFVPVPLLSLVRTYSGTSLKNSSWRQCAQVVWDWYSPRFQWHQALDDVRAWYDAAGFDRVTLLDVSMGAIGRKRAVRLSVLDRPQS